MSPPTDRRPDAATGPADTRRDVPTRPEHWENAPAGSHGAGASQDALKLTAYFGERARAGGRLLADELLDACARRAIRHSVLLRGIQGFGAKHRLRTDRLLTLSEDLPLACVAVDAPERIEALRQELASIPGVGLVTVERCRWAASPDARQLASQAMLTVYLGRHRRVERTPAFAAVCAALREEGVAGATVLLGVDGTACGARRRARFFARNADVPMIAVSVGAGERIARGAERLRRLLGDPTMTFEAVRLCKRDGVLLGAPHSHGEKPPSALSPPTSSPSAPSFAPQAGDDRDGQEARGQLTKLTIIVSEAARHAKRPVYAELIRRLRAADAAGATALRGIWGFHGDHPPHGDRLLSLRRHVPVVIVAIDAPERIAAIFPLVDELTSERGLVTSELVPAH